MINRKGAQEFKLLQPVEINKKDVYRKENILENSSVEFSNFFFITVFRTGFILQRTVSLLGIWSYHAHFHEDNYAAQHPRFDLVEVV